MRKKEILPPPPKSMNEVYGKLDRNEITVQEARLLLRSYAAARRSWLDAFFARIIG